MIVGSSVFSVQIAFQPYRVNAWRVWKEREKRGDGWEGNGVLQTSVGTNFSVQKTPGTSSYLSLPFSLSCFFCFSPLFFLELRIQTHSFYLAKTGMNPGFDFQILFYQNLTFHKCWLLDQTTVLDERTRRHKCTFTCRFGAKVSTNDCFCQKYVYFRFFKNRWYLNVLLHAHKK